MRILFEMDQLKKITDDIRNKAFAPVYFLMGDEPYFIDKITDFIAVHVLTEAERGFNQLTLYGKDTSIDEIVSNAKRYPMMAAYQVVIVKEAQHLSRTIEQLTAYCEQPQPTTLLVVCYKYKTLDKRKKLYKAVSKNGLLFESKKLYENQVADWIRRNLSGKGYGLEPKAGMLLVEFLGTDLGRINNELEKLFLIIDKGATITADLIEKHIGFSKDFNNFELKKAIGERDMTKASRIIDYFAQNPKDNPFVVTVSTLNNFFIQLLQYHGLNDKSSKTVAKTLGVNPFFVKEYQVASHNYPMKRVSGIIHALRVLDLKGKGVGAQNISQADLLKELLVAVS